MNKSDEKSQWISSIEKFQDMLLVEDLISRANSLLPTPTPVEELNLNNLTEAEIKRKISNQQESILRERALRLISESAFKELTVQFGKVTLQNKILSEQAYKTHDQPIKTSTAAKTEQIRASISIKGMLFGSKQRQATMLGSNLPASALIGNSRQKAGEGAFFDAESASQRKRPRNMIRRSRSFNGLNDVLGQIESEMVTESEKSTGNLKPLPGGLFSKLSPLGMMQSSPQITRINDFPSSTGLEQKAHTAKSSSSSSTTVTGGSTAQTATTPSGKELEKKMKKKIKSQMDQLEQKEIEIRRLKDEMQRLACFEEDAKCITQTKADMILLKKELATARLDKSTCVKALRDIEADNERLQDKIDELIEEYNMMELERDEFALERDRVKKQLLEALQELEQIRTQYQLPSSESSSMLMEQARARSKAPSISTLRKKGLLKEGGSYRERSPCISSTLSSDENTTVSTAIPLSDSFSDQLEMDSHMTHHTSTAELPSSLPLDSGMKTSQHDQSEMDAEPNLDNQEEQAVQSEERKGIDSDAYLQAIEEFYDEKSTRASFLSVVSEPSSRLARGNTSTQGPNQVSLEQKAERIRTATISSLRGIKKPLSTVTSSSELVKETKKPNKLLELEGKDSSSTSSSSASSSPKISAGNNGSSDYNSNTGSSCKRESSFAAVAVVSPKTSSIISQPESSSPKISAGNNKSSNKNKTEPSNKSESSVAVAAETDQVLVSPKTQESPQESPSSSASFSPKTSTGNSSNTNTNTNTEPSSKSEPSNSNSNTEPSSRSESPGAAVAVASPKASSTAASPSSSPRKKAEPEVLLTVNEPPEEPREVVGPEKKSSDLLKKLISSGKSSSSGSRSPSPSPSPSASPVSQGGSVSRGTSRGALAALASSSSPSSTPKSASISKASSGKSPIVATSSESVKNLLSRFESN